MSQQIETYTTQLEFKVEERTQKLAAANREIQALNDRLKSENLRMGAELDVARRLQTMVLPKPEELRATLPRLDIAAYMEPASEVGGDYYDVLQCGSRVKIGIGDVTGHGVESGVLMLMVQSVARALLENGEHDPKRFLTVLNQVLVKNIGRANSENNLTLAFLDYDEAGGGLTLSGQHEEVIVVRRDGAVERIDTMDLGFPVGLTDDIATFVATHDLHLDPGDFLVLYTDGITEAENDAGRLFGIDALCASAVAARAGSANEIRQQIIADVTAHIGSQPLRDDLTLVVIKHG
jgi:sigma-B regulation protein RsbU (phosphoserine phosphatase)